MTSADGVQPPIFLALKSLSRRLLRRFRKAWSGTWNGTVSRDDVGRVCRELLHHEPASPDLGAGQSALEFTLSVALGPERAALEEQRVRQALMATTPVWASQADIGWVLTYTRDDVIGGCIRSRGTFEEAEVGEVMKLIADLGAPAPAGLFVDIGANIGTHALYALRNGFQRALCVEADPDNFRLLRANQVLNDLDARCVNVMAAVSDTPGVATMEISPSNFGDRRVRPDASARSGVHGEENWSTIEVPVRRLDSIFAENRIDFRDVGLVWVDTQGHDAHVLKGAPQLLAAGAPVVIEFWPYGLDRSGGYALLKDLIRETRRRVFDVKQSVRAGRAIAVETAEQLDDLFRSLRLNEGKDGWPHTDLLLL
ncbi:MAG: FkbM family methyltransferase [Xanthobacteraceae bacterium]|nr:FkbM family methyltransferase [Xanthobacteraceae bacterium]